MESTSGSRRIARDLTRLALLGAGLPGLILIVLSLLGVLGPVAGRIAVDPDSAAGREALTNPLRDGAEARGQAVEARLSRLAHSSQILAAYAKQVLTHPEVYAPTTSQPVQQPQNTAPSTSANPPGKYTPAAPGGDKSADSNSGSAAASTTDNAAPSAAADKPGGTQAGSAGGQMPAGAKSKLDNPLMYSKSSDGALRKVLDDGGAAVFYRSRGSGVEFTAYEKQRLFATAALDVLLQESVKGDPLCGQAFVLTNDSLLRTYPFKDLMFLEGEKDLTDTPLFAWSKDKANAEGVVWTSPYSSWISGSWVVACLSPIEIGGKLVGVAGCEVSLKGLEDEVLNEGGKDSICWLQRPDGTLLAAATGGAELLGVKALSSAPVPDETTPAKAITDDANILVKHLAVFADQMSEKDFEAGTAVRPYGDKQQGKYLATVALPDEQWLFGATLESRVAGSLHELKAVAIRERLRQILIVIGTVVFGLLLSLLLAWLESRRLGRPLQVLTHKSREIARTARAMPLALSEEGELGELSRAMQDALDAVATRPEETKPDAASLLLSEFSPAPASVVPAVLPAQSSEDSETEAQSPA